MTLEDFNPEKPKPKIYLPEVRTIIDIINSESEDFLKKREKDLAGMSAKKDTLRHSQRITNLGYLFARHHNFSEEEINLFVETCLLHDIGKTELPQKYLSRTTEKFGQKDLKIVGKHAFGGYIYLKHERRSPRVYLPILLHHQYQKKSYPAIGIQFKEIEDVDVDNSRLLAMLDVFDVYAFGRPLSKTDPLPREQAEEKLKEQFDQPGDEEVIDFLFDQYETIKELSQN